MHFLRSNLSAILLAAAFAGSVLAQAPPAPATAPQPAAKSNWPPPGPTPRTADGKPDLSGAWAPNAIRQNVDMIATGVQVPFQPWAEKLYKERKESHAKDDPEARCLPPGVPRMTTTPYPFRIMQTPGLTLIVYEGGAHVWRLIWMDGRQHPKDPNPTFLGDAIGHWEGDTLVVDTVGFNERTWLDAAGHPHGEKLHVVERFTRTDSNTLQVAATIEDPDYYTKPWTVVTTATWAPGQELLEYICQENNRDLQHLVGK